MIGLEETIQKPMEVREVKRKAEVGEWVKIVNDDFSDKKCYYKGDIGKYIEDGKIATIGGFVTTKGTHDCNRGKGTSFLYENEYVVLENYKPPKPLTLKFDLSLTPSSELIAEFSKRLGGN